MAEEVTIEPGAEHPGKELDRKIKELGLTDSHVADQGRLSRPLMSQITNGNRRITVASATKFCRVIGGDPMYWVRKQREHDTWLEERKVMVAQSGASQSDAAGR